MSEQTIIEQCAPTLAGIKTGNLFSVKKEADETAIRQELRRLNKKLRGKGIRILPVGYTKGRMLLYLYRPDRLTRDLMDPDADRILQERGYIRGNADRCLVQLIQHLSDDETFPHEIGLFLGYPPADVRGFMHHTRQGVKQVGYWKVYGNQEEAEVTFAKYKKCTELYRKQYRRGRTLEQLAV